MSGAFGEGTGPLPPKILRNPAEQYALLNQLARQNIPLTLRFQGHNQRFLTYLAGLNREQATLALDEVVPEAGQRLLSRGEPYRIDALLDGVQISWRSVTPPVMGTHDGHAAAWFDFPAELTHHQKRNAFRARTLPDEPISILLSGGGLSEPLTAKVLDLSVSGCKAQVTQAISGLEPGMALNETRLKLPDGTLTTPIEIRFTQIKEKTDSTVFGLRFLRMDGMSQRAIDRYVSHLQREARRREEGDLF